MAKIPWTLIDWPGWPEILKKTIHTVVIANDGRHYEGTPTHVYFKDSTFVHVDLDTALGIADQQKLTKEQMKDIGLIK